MPAPQAACPILCFSDHDADQKRAFLVAWWANLLPDHSYRRVERLQRLDPKASIARLASRPAVPSVYVLLADINGEVTPVPS